jgi:hypothetical protein
MATACNGCEALRESSGWAAIAPAMSSDDRTPAANSGTERIGTSKRVGELLAEAESSGIAKSE